MILGSFKQLKRLARITLHACPMRMLCVYIGLI